MHACISRECMCSATVCNPVGLGCSPPLGGFAFVCYCSGWGLGTMERCTKPCQRDYAPLASRLWLASGLACLSPLGGDAFVCYCSGWGFSTMGRCPKPCQRDYAPLASRLWLASGLACLPPLGGFAFVCYCSGWGFSTMGRCPKPCQRDYAPLESRLWRMGLAKTKSTPHGCVSMRRAYENVRLHSLYFTSVGHFALA